MTHQTTDIDEIDLREIAAALRRDVRTVRKVAAGVRIRGRIADAEIRRAIADRLARRKSPHAA